MLARGELHVDHGVGEHVLVAQGQYAVPEALHDAALGDVELLGGPEGAAPAGAVEAGGLLGVLGELGGDDEGGEDDELGADGVDVQLLVVDEGRGREGVPL